VDSRNLSAHLTDEQESITCRIDRGVRALADARKSCASRTRQHFARGNALQGQGLKTEYLEVVVHQHRIRGSSRSDEEESIQRGLGLLGLIERHTAPWDREARARGYVLTSLAQALLPVLQHEGLASPFVWYVLWINLSGDWLGALSWNMLSQVGATLPLLTEPLCSYLCGNDRVDSQDRGAASSLEESFRHTPWGDLGIGVAPAYGRRLWSRVKPNRVDPLVLLCCLYKCVDVSGVLTIDGQRLASLPYGPGKVLNIDSAAAMRQLLALWVPELLTQQRDGNRIVLSVQPSRSMTDVVLEYVRRRGYL